MNYKIFSLLVGFIIWLLATILFRVAGQFFFITSNTIILISLYIIVIPFLGYVANLVFDKYELSKLESIQSAVIMVLPGMVFDTFCIEYFSLVFPNLSSTDDATFGSWLMWAYATVLVFGLIKKDKK